MATLTLEPLEDGYSHKAEGLLEKTLKDYGEDGARWIRSWILEGKEPGIAADTLRCLGRLSHQFTPEWRLELVRTALMQSAVEIRDAAVQAVEQWQDDSGIELLMEHREKETREWLKAYIDAVVADLSD